MLRESVRLLEVVEEAAIDERHEHARSGNARLHRLPLLVREVRFRCHLLQYRSMLVAGRVERGAAPPAGGKRERAPQRAVASAIESECPASLSSFHALGTR